MGSTNYPHGIDRMELPTSLVPPVRTEAGLPVFVGTAPLHLATDEDAMSNVNKPALCYSYKEAVAKFGYSKDFENYTLCEAIKSQFALFNVAPVVLINVLDPARHKTAVPEADYPIADGKANLGQNVVKSSIVAKNGDEPVTLNTDYVLSYDGEGNLLLGVVKDKGLKDAANVKAKFDRIDPSAVDRDDIIGGIDITTGDYEGLELVNSVFPLFRLLPGTIVVPKWSEDPAVAAVMTAKAGNVNGHFRCTCLCDIPSDVNGADTYQKAPQWKNDNNYTSERQICCWALPKLGDERFRLSTQLAGLIGLVDAKNGDIPYESPSNKNLQMNALVRADGKEINLGLEMANYLNGEGIVTPLNFIGGWKAWGNRTAIYPAVTDPKDSFIPIRRMVDWLGNGFILTFWNEVDKPMTRRLVKRIVNSYNLYLNGLAAREFILGGRIVFVEEENPLTDLIDGKMTFHLHIAPPPPAEHIMSVWEFDPNYLRTLFV